MFLRSRAISVLARQAVHWELMPRTRCDPFRFVWLGPVATRLSPAPSGPRTLSELSERKCGPTFRNLGRAKRQLYSVLNFRNQLNFMFMYYTLNCVCTFTFIGVFDSSNVPQIGLLIWKDFKLSSITVRLKPPISTRKTRQKNLMLAMRMGHTKPCVRC